MNGNIPRMDYRQYRAARRLVHECCNYDGGNCLLLEDGEPCVCVQSISYSLLCRWFTAAVLPLDEALEAALMRRGSRKRCAVCGRRYQKEDHVPTQVITLIVIGAIMFLVIGGT